MISARAFNILLTRHYSKTEAALKLINDELPTWEHDLPSKLACGDLLVRIFPLLQHPIRRTGRSLEEDQG
jgi:hypothetical protein